MRDMLYSPGGETFDLCQAVVKSSAG